MGLLLLNSSNNCQRRTVLPPTERIHHRYDESKIRELVTVTIGCDNLREAVKLPPGVDINEWLAMNTVDFYNQISLFYATLKEFCTSTTCPVMKAGRYEYRWADGTTMVSAPEYVEREPFPPNFEDFVKRILRKLFRVYAHIYHSHFPKIVTLNEQAHLNTCFHRYLLFVSEFQLVDKEEMVPIQKLVETILKP
ncbi:unnamed protein product [Arabidopsis thaliana]|uniref:Uncharacterized protein n=1 Tax=Arabidopsis thaliana TaxID=3702 RepID=A0A5S9Y5U9_ARATH|nr:unnamed protein product [Arabidopsis thaliana]